MFASHAVEVFVCGGAVMHVGGGSLQGEWDGYRIVERILMKPICVVFREEETTRRDAPNTSGRGERRRLYNTPLQFTAHIGVYHQNAYHHRLYTEKRPSALLPPSRRLFLISGTAGNFFAHTLPPPLSPPLWVFLAFVYICILYIYIHRIFSCTVQLLYTYYV